jgi:nucleotide-binding universal stress UspA family protein
MAIVVGVDGSDASKEALRWALAEARLRGTVLRAVLAWEYPFVPPAVEPFPIGPLIEGGETMEPSALRELHGNRLAQIVHEVAGDPADVEIDLDTVEGDAVEVLVDEGRRAELVVVGSRGHGGITGVLVGSVSQAVIQRARCPIVIVHPPD